MSDRAYDLGLRCDTMRNWNTTSEIPPYVQVQLCTTPNGVQMITTLGLKPYGITQQAIPIGETGPVAPGCLGGISRLRMGNVVSATVPLQTTDVWLVADAAGRGERNATTSMFTIAKPMVTYATSDIASIQLVSPRRIHAV